MAGDDSRSPSSSSARRLCFVFESLFLVIIRCFNSACEAFKVYKMSVWFRSLDIGSLRSHTCAGLS